MYWLLTATMTVFLQSSTCVMVVKLKQLVTVIKRMPTGREPSGARSVACMCFALRVIEKVMT